MCYIKIRKLVPSRDNWFYLEQLIKWKNSRPSACFETGQPGVSSVIFPEQKQKKTKH